MAKDNHHLRSDSPPSMLKGAQFGLRVNQDHVVKRSVIGDTAPARQAIARLLAPVQADPGIAVPARTTAVKLRRRVGRDLDLTTTAPPISAPPPAVAQDSERPVASISDLGTLVRARRSQLGFSQQRLADLAGVGRRFVSELEAGKPSLEVDRVLQCCGAIGIDLFARSRS